MQYITQFLKRFSQWNETLAELFKADIVLRVGKQKDDQQFKQNAETRLAKIKDSILEIVDAFEREHQEEVEKTEELKNAVKTIREHISNPVNENFYDSVCTPLATVVGSEYLKFNKAKLMGAAERIAPIEFTDEQRRDMYAKATEGKTGIELEEAKFCFEHGITSTARGEFEEPGDRLIKLAGASRSASKDFLAKAEIFRELPNYQKIIVVAEKMAI